VSAVGWQETYRGTVYRWEVDNNDHLTVAYYFAHLGDATLAVLEGLGLGSAYRERTGCRWVTVDVHARYMHELRVNDIMHITSGVLGVDGDGLRIGHKLFNSETGALCTTFEQRLLHTGAGWAAVALDADARHAAAEREVAWDGPARERRPQPRALEGFEESARDTIKPWEIDTLGGPALSAYIHRFSAANAHALAAFGFTPGYMRTENRGFSTFEFQCAFTGELKAGDPVVVRSALLHVGNSSMRMLHVMVNERTGGRVASLEQSGVHLDLHARRPAPLPDALRERARARLLDWLNMGASKGPNPPNARSAPP
jgi:acyl-CoA thioesterase FadM